VALPEPERAATRSLFGRLVALSSSYSLVGSPQPWELVATVPAIERVDAIALRDRLASAGVIDLYNATGVAPLGYAQPRELQVALTRPEPAVYFGDVVAALDLRFLLWRDPLSSQAWRWNGANADALLRGSALAEAQAWVAGSVDQLTLKEREFIDASTLAHESEIEQKRLREDRERSAGEAHERERREAAEALAAAQGERLKVEEEAARNALQTAARLRRGRLWLLALLGGAFVMAGVALFQAGQARSSAALAQEEEFKARAEAQSADAAARRTGQLLEATKAALESTEQARRAVEASLAARSDDARRLANDQLRTVDNKLIVAQAGIAKVQDSCPVGRRLYLHIAQESDRAAARAMVPLLEKSGFIVPGIELVKEAPRGGDVRYFRRGEEANARAAASVLRDFGVRSIQVRFVEGFETSAKVRPCHYEAWLGDDALPKSKG